MVHSHTRMVPSLVLLVPSVIAVSGGILFLLNTQPGAQHQAIASRTEQFLVSQYTRRGQEVPDIFWSHRDLQYPASLSSWAVFPICNTLFQRFTFT